MKKAMILCCILAVIFVLNISAQQLGDIYTERSAGFSMSMPAGWQTQDFNQKYLSIVGPLDGRLLRILVLPMKIIPGLFPVILTQLWGYFQLFFLTLHY